MQTEKRPAGRPGIHSKTHKNFATTPHLWQGSSHPVQTFCQAMNDAGVGTTDQIIPDGKLHRCRVDGDKPGTRNGWYVLHLDPPVSGQFGSWRMGVSKTWCALGRDRLTSSELEAIRQRIDASRQARQQEIERKHRAAQLVAGQIWKNAHPSADTHPYLTRKHVRSHGLRITPLWKKYILGTNGAWRDLIVKHALLVPMMDWSSTLYNLQAIFPSKVADLGRDKDFLTGGRKKGLFYLLGNIEPTGTLILAEGYSTSATLHETTGIPVLICFDCGGLKTVAVEARRRYPQIDLVVAADNDAGTPGNPGITKAKEAAFASQARLAIPNFQAEVAA